MARRGFPLITDPGAMIFYRLDRDVHSVAPLWCHLGAMILSGQAQTYTPVGIPLLTRWEP